MPEEKYPPLDKDVDLSFEYLGALREAADSDWYDNFYNVNDKSVTSAGIRKVYYSTKSGAAHCVGCNSSRCRHAIRIAEHFHKGGRINE